MYPEWEGAYMKRSEINAAIRKAYTLLERYRVALPPWADWTPQEWAGKGPECGEIRDNMLGWDVTDYGLGDFSTTGLTLVTLRNGSVTDPRYPKTYAEKLLVSQENQVCPMHFHWSKMEDIINRGGGTLMVQLYNADAAEGLSDADVIVVCDGIAQTVPAGTVLELPPGHSVTLTQRLYHAFWAKEGGGPVLIGEVSQCNDDNNDNRFHTPMGRFPRIEEDEPPYRLLCNEYP